MAEKTFLQAIREALIEEMQRDENIFLLGEDIGVYGGAFGVTKGLLEIFGEERIRDTPMSESAIIGASTGAAIAGSIPIAEIMFEDFITLAMDQLVNHASIFNYISNGQIRVPFVIRTASGAGRGYGATHSKSLESWLVSIPGIKVVSPSSPYDAKGLLKSSIRDNNPVVFVENKLLYSTKGEVPDEDYTLPIGKAIRKKEGEDITIISYSRMVHLSLEAAFCLEREGISAEVIDLRTLNPIDKKTITDSVKKTGRAVTVEEGWGTCGIGSEITSLIVDEVFDYLDAPIKRISAANVPVPCCPSLENASLPDTKTIKRICEELM